jgi:hypothetical protein
MPLETRDFEDLGALAAMPLETRHFEDLGDYLFAPMIERLSVAQQHAGELLGGRTVWMVNSTALGGGVAQLLRTLLPYWRGSGVDVRWMVLRGSVEFFRVTKRFHNHLQGQPGDGDVLGIDALATLDRAAHDHARVLASLLAPGDVVVLNDPQTAAMSVPLERAGANVIWCCHVGIDNDNEFSESAWRCLRPRLAGARCFVFSRYTSLPEWLGGAETSILTPGIDPASTKNLPMSDGAASAILQHLGLAAEVSTATPRYDCTDGSTAPLAARRSSYGPGLRRGTGLEPGPRRRLAGSVGPHQGPARDPGGLPRAGVSGDRRAPPPRGPRREPGRR